MQSKSISSRFLKSVKLSMCVLGAVFLCTLALSTLAATSFNTTKILKSSQPQNNAEVIEFLAGDDDKAKLLFFREAFEKQKIHLFEKPQQYFEENYPLKDYVQAWSLLAQVRSEPQNNQLQKELQRFIEQHKNDYIAERVKTDRILIMAPYWDQNRQWTRFKSARSQLQWNHSEPSIMCWDLFHRFRNQKNISKTVAHDALTLINSPRYKGNAVCRKVSDILINKVPSTAFTRLVILIQQGRISEGKQVLNTLIKKKRLPAQAARLAFNNPSRWYRINRNKLSKQNKHVRIIAAYRLTSVNFDWAVKTADSLQGKLNKQEKSALWGRLGYVAAIGHDPKALKWFEKGGPTVCTGPYSALPNDCLEWRARAALRAQQWKTLNRYIASMPASLAKQDNWTYWRGRALTQIGQKESAQTYWQQLRSVRTFYGKLAHEALGQSFYYSGNETVEATPEAIEAMGNNPGLLRAKAFYDVGMFYEGNLEWQWSIRTMNPAQLLAASQWGEKHSLLHRAINTAIKVAEHYPVEHELLYPRPFEDEIETYAKKAKVDTDWVFGLIRQESRFIAAAQSNVGANGLMQIMPATAKWIAKGLGIENFKSEDIYEIDTNIYFGTTYLRSLLDRLDNNIILATAGYNAGPNRASRWQRSLPNVTEAAVFIETIPFTETRNYVQNVLANTVEYAHGQNKTIKSFKDWLGVIDPEADTSTEEKI
ncbi:MAG TPA: lytic transglycosylase domain-containing protein [Candidatus Aphodousia faecavium]|nr:lytic transglycosylase domain-containing protein [Candidatus Aphodousia faecavium]